MMSWLLTIIAGGIVGKNLIKEAMTPTLTADDWFNKYLMDEDNLYKGIPMKQVLKLAAQGRYRYNPEYANSVKETFVYDCNGCPSVGTIVSKMARLLNNGYGVELKVIPHKEWGISRYDMDELKTLKSVLDIAIRRKQKVTVEVEKAENGIKFIPKKI